MKVFGITGRSGSGKTSLLDRLIPCLTAQGFKVSVIKHAHHTVDLDQPGKDSYRYRQAGAEEVILATPTRWALLRELRDAPEPMLAELLSRLAPCDLVLIEGFKQEPVPKLEVYRPAWGKPPLYPERTDLLALATDADPHQLPKPCPPLLPLNQPDMIAAFILETLELEPRIPC